MHSTFKPKYRYRIIKFFLLALVFVSRGMDMIRLSMAERSLSNTTCLDIERTALLSFKQGIKDPSDRLSSWIGVDCCKWSGVECKMSGNVIKLDLRNSLPSTVSDIALTEEEKINAFSMSCLGGNINSSLLELEYLEYLDLSLNCFEGLQIPEFFGMLKKLRYLNLSSSSFGGEIPPHLGNLSSLHYLDLHMDNFFGPPQYILMSSRLQWLSGLTSMKYLNMENIGLTEKGSEVLQSVSMIPSLEELHLRRCNLYNLPLSLPCINFTSLSVLDLSNNEFVSSIPNWIYNLTSLTYLDLSNDYYNLNGNIPTKCGEKTLEEDLDPQLYYGMKGPITGALGSLCSLKVLNLSGNCLTGEIYEFLESFTTFCPNNRLVSLGLNGNQLTGDLPSSLGKLKYLKQLDISHNCFWGSIPETIGNLSFLKELDVSKNGMNGTIPRSLGKLSKITDLNLELNHWQGVITEETLMNLTKLRNLRVSSDKARPLVFNVTPEWNPPFRLLSLEINDCVVGPIFPAWIRVQSELNFVVLHNTGIEDTIPVDWFSNISSQVINLELSDNKIKGKLPQKLKCPQLQFLDLRNNQFEGPVPLWLTNATYYFLQKNLFSGDLPDNISELTQLIILDVSSNHLTGMIPSSICALLSLQVLSLRENYFSGEIPQCWNDNPLLWVLDMSSNNLSGEIPDSISLIPQLSILNLSNNSLTGKIPLSLENCTILRSLDLGDNKLSGSLPPWIGNRPSQFWTIRLRSNKLSGTIPTQWCNLSTIHILDLAENNLSGVIPSCLGNLYSLIYSNISSNRQYFDTDTYIFEEQMLVVTKGREMEFSSTLRFVNVINLSSNNLTGEIPNGITNLTALGTLNISRNHLTGRIPDEIGNIRWLETLDLSMNKLSGPLPNSMSLLASLSNFNVSYNNLAGVIPLGNQLQTLTDVSIYEGNPLLCGKPLPSKCPGHDHKPSADVPISQSLDDDNELENLLFYCCGFVVGICSVWCTLWKKDTWREAYFRLLKLD